MPSIPRAVPGLVLGLACLGSLACTPRYHHTDLSWEPPTAVEARVERIREKANAEGKGAAPQARAADGTTRA